MPTGYTASIKDGISFEQFVWRCARAMGALVMMRDDPADAPIPERFEPSPYYATSLAQADAELSRLKAMTPEDAAAAALRDHLDAMERFKVRAKERNSLRSNYETMLAQVRAWEPPSADHHGFKSFMIQQLSESIDWDCDERYEVVPKQIDGAEWLAAQIIEAHRKQQYAEKALAEENERMAGRNKWLADLRSSLAECAK